MVLLTPLSWLTAGSRRHIEMKTQNILGLNRLNIPPCSDSERRDMLATRGETFWPRGESHLERHAGHEGRAAWRDMLERLEKEEKGRNMLQ